MASEDKTQALDEQQIARLLEQVGERPSPPDDMRQAIKQNLKQVWREEVQAQNNNSTRASGFRFAAAAVFVLSVTSLLWFLNGPGAGTPAPLGQITQMVETVQYRSDTGWQDMAGGDINETLTLRTLTNSYAAIKLSSGMDLRLAPNSQIEFDTVSRIKLNHGQVYIDNQNADASITIVTPLGEATDIGTQFMVELKPAQMQVQVREGRVALKRQGDAEPLLTEAGERLLINAASTEPQRSAISAHDQSWQWVQVVGPRFELEGASLKSYLAWVGRETGMEITYHSDLAETAAQRTILHGSIDDLKPIESLALILATTRFKVDQEPGRLLVTNL